MSVDALIGAVLRFEGAVLEPELLEAILANLSPEPEARALRALKGVLPSELSPPERFCYQLARMPRLRPMLQSLALRQSLPALLERATRALTTVAEAARQLMSSRAFVRILASIVAHGNFLNAGTPRANARGVKLDGVDKARGVKSADGKLNLLEHACAATRLDAAALGAELGRVRPACALPLLDVVRMIQEVDDGAEAVAAELALCPVADVELEVAAEAAHAPPPDAEASSASADVVPDEAKVAMRFRASMSPFLDALRGGLASLTALRDETKALLRKLAVWLGEDASTANPDTFLKTCAELIDVAIAVAPPPPDPDDDEQADPGGGSDGARLARGRASQLEAVEHMMDT